MPAAGAAPQASTSIITVPTTTRSLSPLTTSTNATGTTSNTTAPGASSSTSGLGASSSSALKTTTTATTVPTSLTNTASSGGPSASLPSAGTGTGTGSSSALGPGVSFASAQTGAAIATGRAEHHIPSLADLPNLSPAGAFEGGTASALAAAAGAAPSDLLTSSIDSLSLDDILAQALAHAASPLQGLSDNTFSLSDLTSDTSLSGLLQQPAAAGAGPGAGAQQQQPQRLLPMQAPAQEGPQLPLLAPVAALGVAWAQLGGGVSVGTGAGAGTSLSLSSLTDGSSLSSLSSLLAGLHTAPAAKPGPTAAQPAAHAQAQILSGAAGAPPAGAGAGATTGPVLGGLQGQGRQGERRPAAHQDPAAAFAAEAVANMEGGEDLGALLRKLGLGPPPASTAAPASGAAGGAALAPQAMAGHGASGAGGPGGRTPGVQPLAALPGLASTQPPGAGGAADGRAVRPALSLADLTPEALDDLSIDELLSLQLSLPGTASLLLDQGLGEEVSVPSLSELSLPPGLQQPHQQLLLSTQGAQPLFGGSVGAGAAAGSQAAGFASASAAAGLASASSASSAWGSHAEAFDASAMLGLSGLQPIPEEGLPVVSVAPGQEQALATAPVTAATGTTAAGLIGAGVPAIGAFAGSDPLADLTQGPVQLAAAGLGMVSAEASLSASLTGSDGLSVDSTELGLGSLGTSLGGMGDSLGGALGGGVGLGALGPALAQGLGGGAGGGGGGGRLDEEGGVRESQESEAFSDIMNRLLADINRGLAAVGGIEAAAGTGAFATADEAASGAGLRAGAPAAAAASAQAASSSSFSALSSLGVSGGITSSSGAQTLSSLQVSSGSSGQVGPGATDAPGGESLLGGLP